MDLKKIVERLLQETKIKVQKEVDVVLLDKGQPVMYEDAFRLWPDSGKIEKLWVHFPDTDEYEELGDKKRPEAVISLDGEDLVSFHETRPSSKTHLPNGIQVNHKNSTASLVVFFNVGSEPLTIEGEWKKQGEFKIAIEPGPDITRPDVQQALNAFIRSEAVLEEVESIRQEMTRKKEV